MGYFTRLLNFEEQLTFYGAYHHNTVNKWIHIICVPILVFTALIWLSQPTTMPLLFQFPITMPWFIPTTVTPAWIIAMFYTGYYMLLEPFAGMLYAPFMTAMVIGAHMFNMTFNHDAGMYALVLHITAWVLQFVGHGVFEKRAPALLTSLVQALLLAPLFVWMEVLFLFGYRKRLQERLDKKTVAAIAEWKKSLKDGGKPKSGKKRN